MKRLHGLDTNILLRALTEDDPKQSPAATSVLEEAERRGDRFHLSVPVLCELVWSLRGGRYRFRRQALVEVLENLLQTPTFEVQHRDLVRRAVSDFRDGPGDFSDYLISRLDEANGCDKTLTFDGTLAGHGRFEFLQT